MNKLQVRTLLHGQNYRLTTEREELLDIFAASSCMLTPSQLHKLATQHNLKIGLTTVYRLLEVLTKVGVATPFLVDGSIYYAFCGTEHHHHFVCLSCHHVLDIHEDCPSFRVPENFRVSNHRSDLFGTCPDCQTELETGRFQ